MIPTSGGALSLIGYALQVPQGIKHLAIDHAAGNGVEAMALWAIIAIKFVAFLCAFHYKPAGGRICMYGDQMKPAEIEQLALENQQLRDAISHMKARIDELELLADSDTLTPLPNRRAFLRRLDAVIRHAARHNTPAAILFIDLDRLKRINDDYGHHAGDVVLKHVARQLSASLRATDMVARIGGDEFGLILDHLDEANACTKAHALSAMIAATKVDLGTVTIQVGVTVGVAAVRPDDSVDSLLERADHAMYAKRLYRSRI